MNDESRAAIPALPLAAAVPPPRRAHVPASASSRASTRPSSSSSAASGGAGAGAGAVTGWQSSRALAAASARAAASAAAHAAHVASVSSPSAASAASLALARAADQRIAAHASWTALVAPTHVRRRLELAHDPTAEPHDALQAARTTKAIRSLLPAHAILAAARGIYPQDDSSGGKKAQRQVAAPRTAQLGVADRVDLSLSLAQNAREAACIRKEQLQLQQQQQSSNQTTASSPAPAHVSPTRAPLSLASTLPAALSPSCSAPPSSSSAGSPLIDSLLRSSFFRTSYTHRFEDETLGLTASEKLALQKCRNMEAYKRECQRKIQEAQAQQAQPPPQSEAKDCAPWADHPTRSPTRGKSAASHLSGVALNSPPNPAAATGTGTGTAAVASVMAAYAFNDESSDDSGTEGETGRRFLDKIRAETARHQRQPHAAGRMDGETGSLQQIVPQFGSELPALPSRPATSPVISATAGLSLPSPRSAGSKKFSASAVLPPPHPHPEVLAELARLRSEVHSRDRAQAKRVGVLHEPAGTFTAAAAVGETLEVPLESEEADEEEKSTEAAVAASSSAAASAPRCRFTRHDPFYTALSCWMSQHGKLAKSAAIDPAQVDRCATMFDLLDENGDGVVQLSELSRALSALGGGGVKIDLTALKSSLSGFDPDSDGCLNFSEFLHGFSSLSTWDTHLTHLLAARAEAQRKAGTLRREARLWKDVEVRAERARKQRIAREKTEALAKAAEQAEEARREQVRRTKERLKLERIARDIEERAPPQLLAASALASHSSAALLYGVATEEPERTHALEPAEQKHPPALTVASSSPHASPALSASHTYASAQPSPRSPASTPRRALAAVAASPTSIALGGSSGTRPPVLILTAPSVSTSIRPPVLALTSPSSIASPRKLKAKLAPAAAPPAPVSFTEIQAQLLGGKPVTPLPAVGVAVHLGVEERQAIAELRARTASRNAAAESRFLSLTQPRVAATAAATSKDSRAYDRALKRQKARRPNRALPPEVAAALGLAATQDRGKLAPASARTNRSPTRLLAQCAPVAVVAAATASAAATPTNAASLDPSSTAVVASVVPSAAAPSRPLTSHADLPFFLWTSAFQRHSRLDHLIKEHSSDQTADEIEQAQSIDETRRDIEASFAAAQAREQQQLREQMATMVAAGHAAAAMALGRTLITTPAGATNTKPNRSRRSSLLPPAVAGGDPAALLLLPAAVDASRSASPTKSAAAAASKSPLLSMPLLLDSINVSAAAGASSLRSSMMLAQMLAEEEKQTEEQAEAAATKGHRRKPSSGGGGGGEGGVTSVSSPFHDLSQPRSAAASGLSGVPRSRFGQHQSRRSIESLAAAATARGPTPPLSFAPTAQTHAPQPRPPSQRSAKQAGGGASASPTTALALLSQVAASIAAAGAEARRIAAEASPNVLAHVLTRVPLSATVSDDEIALHAAAAMDAAAAGELEDHPGAKSHSSGDRVKSASAVRVASASPSRPSSRQRVRRGDQLSYVTVTDLTHVSAFAQAHHGIGLKPVAPSPSLAGGEAMISPRSSGRMLFARGNGLVEEGTDPQHQHRGHGGHHSIGSLAALQSASRSGLVSAPSASASVATSASAGRSHSPISPASSPSKRDAPLRLRRGEGLSPSGVVPEQSPLGTPTIEEDGYAFPAAAVAAASAATAAVAAPVKSSGVRVSVERAQALRTLSSLWHSVREEGAQTVLDAIALATREGTLAATSPANFGASKARPTSSSGAPATGVRHAGVLKPSAPPTSRTLVTAAPAAAAASSLPEPAAAPVAPLSRPSPPVLLQLKQPSLANRALSLVEPAAAVPAAAPVLPSPLSSRASPLLSYPRPLPDDPSDDDEDLHSDDDEDGIGSPVATGVRSTARSGHNTPHARREPPLPLPQPPPPQQHTLDPLDE